MGLAGHAAHLHMRMCGWMGACGDGWVDGRQHEGLRASGGRTASPSHARTHAPILNPIRLLNLPRQAEHRHSDLTKPPLHPSFVLIAVAHSKGRRAPSACASRQQRLALGKALLRLRQNPGLASED